MSENQLIANSRCTLLVNSCDAYADAWKPFFRLLKIMWPNMNLPVVLNTESMKYSDPYFSVRVLNQLLCGFPITWGQRLLDVLERIETEYVLFMLEDYFFEAPINVQAIEQCIKWMELDSDIVTFQFNPTAEYEDPQYLGYKDFCKYYGFAKRPRNAYFKMCAGPGLWRRSELMRLTTKRDSPWDWEYFGSLRTWLYPKSFYCRRIDVTPIVVYDVKRGGAIHRGKWVGATVRPLNEMYALEIDFDKRGVVEDWTENSMKVKRNYLRKIRNRTKFALSYLYGLRWFFTTE